MEYRFAEAEDMEQVETLWDYCFEKKEEPFFQYYFSQYNGKENRVYGAFQKTETGEKLQSMVHLNPYTVRINGQWVEIPYLVGVATAQEARGHHLMGKMLQHLLAEPEIAQLPFVFLMPINAGIYLPYDFAYTHYRHEYKLPLKALEELPDAKGIQVEKLELSLGAKGLLGPLYESLTDQYNGVNQRGFKQWQKLLTVCLQENMQLAVASCETAKAGYMLYHQAEACLEIFELLASGSEVRNALLKQAAKAAAEQGLTQIHWLAPMEDKLYLNFRDQANTGSLVPFMMFRVVNRDAAIKLCVAGEQSAGTVGQALRQIFDQEQLPMASLAQLLLGTFTASELQEAGAIKVKNAETLKQLDACFPKQRNWINEYF